MKPSNGAINKPSSAKPLEQALEAVRKKISETGRVGLTEKELCAVLGLCRLTVMRNRQAGKLRYCKLTATKLLYLPEHIEEFLKNCERLDTPRRARATAR